MRSEHVDRFDDVTRKAIGDYTGPLARVGLRAEYAGLTALDPAAGDEQSAVEVWVYHGSELVDSIEVWVERPGLGRRTPEEVDAEVRRELGEMLALHEIAAATRGRRGALVPVPAAVLEPAAAAAAAVAERRSDSPYVQRLHALYFKVMPGVALSLSGSLLAMGEDAVSALLLGPAGAFIGLPTAMVGSLAHTKAMESIGRETVPLSAALGAGIGAAAGAFTPWFFPSFNPMMIGLGGLAGAVYGAIVARWHRLSDVWPAAELEAEAGPEDGGSSPTPGSAPP